MQALNIDINITKGVESILEYIFGAFYAIFSLVGVLYAFIAFRNYKKEKILQESIQNAGGESIHTSLSVGMLALTLFLSFSITLTCVCGIINL